MLSDVPTAPSIVSVLPGDSRVFVRDRLPDGTLTDPSALVARGVNWSPDSVGTPREALQLEFARWYQTDIPLMAKMGVNVVRVYHDFGTGQQAFDILDELYRQDIKVIMTVDFPREGRLADTQNISTVVNAYKNHPAILMWAVGNEWDLNNAGTGFYGGLFQTLAEAAGFIEQSAELVKSLDSNHPVTTFMADPNIISFHPLSPQAFPFALARPYTSEIVADLVPSVDVWSFNVYRGSSFQDVFQMWRSISTKPMLIGEFGADSYDHRVNGENQHMQAQFNAGLWDELYFELSAERVNGSVVGGLVFELQDEWWKNGDPFHQDVSAEQNWGQPDGFNDEEFFGLTTIDRQPKEGYAAMQARYVTGQSAVVLNPTPTLRAISQGPDVWNSGAEFQLDDKTVFLRGGGQYGGRGINVAVLDPHTGIRMQGVRNFDTWFMKGGWGGPHTHFRELTAYLRSLPNGTILALAIGDDGGFIMGPGGDPWPDPYVEQGYKALEALGSQQIRQVEYNGGWVMIVQKGVGVLAEARSGASEAVSVQAPLSLELNPDFGRRPLFSINDVAGHRGATPFVFTVTRSGGVDVPATVHFATADGTATATGGDYQSISADLSFDPGEISKEITVLVDGAVNYENDVTFTVNLTGGGDASIIRATGIGTIQHDDPPPPLSPGDSSHRAGAGGTLILMFSRSLASGAGLPVTVHYAGLDGTAITGGGECQASSADIVFPSKTVAVLVIGESKFESREMSSARLREAGSGNLAPSFGKVPIKKGMKSVDMINKLFEVDACG